MKIAKIFEKLFIGLVVFVFFGCTGILEDSPDKDLSNVNGENYGSLIVIPSKSMNARYIDTDDITTATVTISGTGITAGKEPKVESIPVENGGAKGIEINNIPVGKNRIVTVQAFSKNGKMDGITIRNIVDISGKTTNTIYVNWSTTALGNVFYEISKLNYDISTITESQKNSIISAIPEATHSALIDAKEIAKGFIDYVNGISFQESKYYSLSPASLTFAYTLENGETPYSVAVGDPCSELKENCTFEEIYTMEGIAPGEWTVYFIAKDGSILNKATAVFESGKNVDWSTKNWNNIILHAYDYINVYVWGKSTALDASLEKKHFPLAQEGDTKWYTITLDVPESNIIFTKELNGWTGKTGDLSRTAGEWWYKNGEWSDYPEDTVPPTISFIAGQDGMNCSKSVEFKVTASDNNELVKVEYYIDDKKKYTAKEYPYYYECDTTLMKNGSHTVKAIAYDKAGNASEAATITITTQNVNTPPVAVIEGAKKVAFGKSVEYRGTSSYDPNGEIMSYKWSISGSGATLDSDTNSKINITFPNSQETFTLSLTVTDDEGATNTTSITIETLEPSAVEWDFREETIYFAMTTRFYDGDPSNNVHCWDENPATSADDPSWRGDFKGLIEKLDYLKALGFTAIWITPVVENASGLDYHGYHAMNFSKVDPRYESNDVKFHDLIDAVHEKGMKLILDVVFNHTGNFGEAYLAPMFKKDYNADLSQITECMKLCDDSLLTQEFSVNNIEDYFALPGATQYQQRLAVMKNTDNINHDTQNFYHHYANYSWDDFTCQWGQIAGDCVDLNTENPAVLKYIVDAYSQYIKMGVDAFRIDTVKHIPRLVFNKYLNKRFHEAAADAGNNNFYMFGEVCARANEVVYRNTPNMSAFFYTWDDDNGYAWSDDEHLWDGEVLFETDMPQMPFTNGEITYDIVNGRSSHQQGLDYAQGKTYSQTSTNHALDGNNYHEPDYSLASGLNVIDFPMHWNFNNASGAFSVKGEDYRYNDATWNVVYVDSHDYAPCGDDTHRYHGGTDAWAENMSLMWTFRGIPCLYYGSEIEFMKGAIIDKGPLEALCDTGRAYYGDYLEGTINTTDIGKYIATGAVAETLKQPLCKHLMRLNLIRRAIPALQKGQYSTENCSGSMSFKRRYTKGDIDSFALVTISGDSTFTGLPAGTYIDAVTGDTQTISEGGTITATCSGQGNMRVYVLQTSSSEVSGAIGSDIGDEYLK